MRQRYLVCGQADYETMIQAEKDLCKGRGFWQCSEMAGLTP